MTDYLRKDYENHLNAVPDEDGFVVTNGLISACAELQQWHGRKMEGNNEQENVPAVKQDGD